MLKQYFSSLPEDFAIPSVLVVGCGRVGESIVRAYVDNAPHGSVSIYVTDSDKERARKLSEYRLSCITPIRWRSAHDTPEDVDIIVIAVDHDSEYKVIDRLALSKKPFVSLSDDAAVFEAYEEYEDEFRESNVRGIIGTGLVPGVSNILMHKFAQNFDKVLDIVVERLGFVSASSLASLKNARKESPLSVRDGIISDSRRDAGNALSWFPSPYDLVELQSVATGVLALKQSFPDSHNISVRFAEPKLPTFSERVRNIFLKVPLTTTRACVKVEIHGIIDGEIQTRVYALAGDAMKIITQTSVMAINGLFNADVYQDRDEIFLNCDEVIDSDELLVSLCESDISLYRFDGNEI